MSRSGGSNPADDMNVSRALTWRYVIALLLVATLSTAAWISLRLVISEQKSTAAIVNVSGRQRMLSQRTALFSSLLVNTPKAGREAVRSKLQEAIDLMEHSHHGLTHGDAEMGLPESMSPAVHAMYFDGPDPLDQQVETYVRAVRSLLRENDDALTPDNPLVQYISRAAPTTLVSSLDKMVFQYQLEGESAVRHLQRVETIFWMITLLLLALEALFIFRPFATHVRAIIGKLKSVTDELRSHKEKLEMLVRQRTAELEQRSEALAESEEKFRLISTAAQEAIMIIDTSGAIAYWNPAAEKIFGYTEEEAMGKDMHTLLVPARYQDMAQSGFENFRTSGQGGFIGKTLEITALRKSGEEFPIELSISALNLHNNWHAQGMIRDITERKRAEAELLRSNADLTRFAEVSAHHLMEPVRRLSIYSQRLRTRLEVLPEERYDWEMAESIDAIEHDADYLRNLVRDIQLYLVAREPRGEVLKQDVNDVLETLKGRMRTRVADMGAILEIESLPDAVLDKPRLTDLFLVLLENALQHGRPGDPAIPLHIRVSGERDGLITRYFVIDNGPGIPSQYLERVFEIFERLAPRGEESGSGIGLSIARRIVESRSGKIQIKNQPQGGVMVIFELPDGGE